MYNVRYIEYPDGYQVRLYDRGIGTKSEMQLRDKSEKNFGSPWIPVNFSWEDIPDCEIPKRRESDKSFSKYVSLNRTKNMIYYLARSNYWDYFVTLTIAPDARINRYDFPECSSKVRKWFEHLKARKCPDMKYLIVPEQHKDGAYHFHALVGNTNGLSFVDSGHKSGEKIVYNFENWKFGFSTAVICTEISKVSAYICKYITKDLGNSTKNLRRYWASNNLDRAPIFEGCVPPDQHDEFKKMLYENQNFCKMIKNEYLEVLYFEIEKKKESS